MVSSVEKQEKVRSIITGLSKMSQLRKEAARKKKARKYIKIAGKVLRTSLWLAPLVLGLMEPLLEEAEAEDVEGEDQADISDELEAFAMFDPELLVAANEVFQQLEELGDTLSEEVMDALVNEIDPDALPMADIDAAECMVQDMYMQMQCVL